MLEILATAAVVGFAVGFAGVAYPSSLRQVMAAVVLCTAFITVFGLLQGESLPSAVGQGALFSVVVLAAGPLGAWWRARRRRDTEAPLGD